MSLVQFQAINKKDAMRHVMNMAICRAKSGIFEAFAQWGGFTIDGGLTEADVQFFSQGYIWIAGTDEQICFAVDDMGGLKHFSESFYVSDPDNSLQFCNKDHDPKYYLYELSSLKNQLRALYLANGQPYANIDDVSVELTGKAKETAIMLKREIAKYETDHQTPYFVAKMGKIPTSQSNGVAKIKQVFGKQA